MNKESKQEATYMVQQRDKRSYKKNYNRRKRQAEIGEERDRLTYLYNRQKKHTQNMIKEEITKHEQNISMKIMKEKGRKQLQELINTLRGKKKHKKQSTRFYNEQEEIEEIQYHSHINKYWKDIYEMHTFKIEEEWNN